MLMTLPAVAAAGPAGPVPPWWPRGSQATPPPLARLPVLTEAAMPGSNSLSSIQHIVVLMLENRSFDHMLGFLYANAGNVSPAGHAFEGLSGIESNPDDDGSPVSVFKIDPTAEYAYFMPGADPGEGFSATNSELYDTTKPGAGATPNNQG